MKILTIVYTLNRGGTERAAQNFSIAFKKYGLEVAVLPLYEKGVREKALLEYDIKVLDPYKGEKFNLSELISFAPDIVHIHRAGIKDDVINELLILIRNNCTGVKVAETNVFSQVDFSEGEQQIDLHMHLSKWCFWKWKTDRKLFQNTSTSIVLPYLVIPDKFKKINDLNVINEFKKSNNIPLNKFILGRVAQKSEAKWSLLDIKSFLNISDKYSDTHLVLLGVSPKAMVFIDGLSNEQREKITVLDYIDGDENLNILYNSFDLFIHAAKIGESFGMVFAESMLAETPVVTLATPMNDNSQHEVIPGGAGIVAKSVDVMIEAINSFYSDREKLAKYGKNARDHILESYTPNVLTSRVIKAFELLVEFKGDKLEKELRKNNFITDVNKNEITRLYNTAQGKTSFKEKLFFLSPWLFVRFRELYRGLRS
jgi:glycosyltransferase involved in cell wall biosynthesis